VKGKKNPQPVQKFIGTITPDGLVQSMVRKISTDPVKVYEYGFSFALERIMPTRFWTDFHDPVKAHNVFLLIVERFSPRSYLLRDVLLPSKEDLSVCIDAQIRKCERLCGFTFDLLIPLMHWYLVSTKEQDMLSEKSEEMELILKKIGVKSNDIQE
jgi:hypothetical protein